MPDDLPGRGSLRTCARKAYGAAPASGLGPLFLIPLVPADLGRLAMRLPLTHLAVIGIAAAILIAVTLARHEARSRRSGAATKHRRPLALPRIVLISLVAGVGAAATLELLATALELLALLLETLDEAVGG